MIRRLLAGCALCCALAATAFATAARAQTGPTSIAAPANFVPLSAIAWGGLGAAAKPVTLPDPLPVQLSSVPLPTGAATAVAQAVEAANIAQDAANNAPFGGEVALTVGVADTTARRSLKASCTAAGAVPVTYADGSTGVWAAAVGVQTFPIAVTTVLASGLTATCTYANLK